METSQLELKEAMLSQSEDTNGKDKRVKGIDEEDDADCHSLSEISSDEQ